MGSLVKYSVRYFYGATKTVELEGTGYQIGEDFITFFKGQLQVFTLPKAAVKEIRIVDTDVIPPLE